MLTRRLRAWTAWFCVVVIALIGVTPAQGLVLCLEPDGTVALEVGTPDYACGGCAQELGEGQPSGPASEENCPCIDIPIFSLGEEAQVRPRTIEISLEGPWLECPLARVLVSVAPVESPIRPVVAPPRPPDGLAFIRTVVLLV